VSRSGSNWTFTTPTSGNALINGPALERWGQLRTTFDVAPGDGQALLAVQTTDLGGGTYHYEYALLNMNSDRRIRSFRIPVGGVSNITNIGFHDNDTDAANDWQVSVDPAEIRWETDTYDANPDAEAARVRLHGQLPLRRRCRPRRSRRGHGHLQAGDGKQCGRGDARPVQLGNGRRSGAATRRSLVGSVPNPSNRPTSIAYELPSAGRVRLDVYDAAGRLVRALVDDHARAGSHTARWDGKNTNGSRAPAGVYYARLQMAGSTVAKPLVRTRDRETPAKNG
jgi:hypothetical protein